MCYAKIKMTNKHKINFNLGKTTPVRDSLLLGLVIWEGTGKVPSTICAQVFCVRLNQVLLFVSRLSKLIFFDRTTYTQHHRGLINSPSLKTTNSIASSNITINQSSINQSINY